MGVIHRRHTEGIKVTEVAKGKDNDYGVQVGGTST